MAKSNLIQEKIRKKISDKIHFRKVVSKIDIKKIIIAKKRGLK